MSLFYDRGFIHIIDITIFFFQQIKIIATNEEFSIIIIHSTKITAALASFHDRRAFFIHDMTIFQKFKAIRNSVITNIISTKPISLNFGSCRCITYEIKHYTISRLKCIAKNKRKGFF